MLKALYSSELLLSLAFLVLPLWAVSGLCQGRPLGYDCESWFIFGLNFYFPIGLVGLACSIWSLQTGSWRSQPVLLITCLLTTAYWRSNL